uniref:FG-GAP repeat protein n=1 Tax=Solibacter usitatus (strain Ellin6076) TaxID=234267 RepID=Q01TD2_SOLUE
MKTARFTLVFLASLLTGMDQNRAVPQFAPAAFYKIAPTHYRIGTFFKVADVNGDGFADVIVVAPGTMAITVWLGDGSGKFKDRVDSELGGVVYSGGNAAAGDFDGDGHLDLAIAMNNSPLHVMKGDGKGGFKFFSQLERVGPIVDCPGPLFAADLNHDGKTDIVANQCGGGIAIFPGKGDGTFSSPRKIEVPEINRSVDQSMVLADFNNDGYIDIAVGTMTGAAVLLADKEGNFAAPLSLATGFPMKIATADLNRDGNADLVVLPVDPKLEPSPMLGSAGNQVSIFLGDGKGAFKALPPFSATLSNFTADGGFPYHLEIADLNGDHVPDLILTKQQYSFKTELPLIRWMVLLGRGDGTFPNPVEFRNPAESRNYPRYSFALADVNGDQKPDVLFLDDRSGQQIGIALNVTKSIAAPSATKPTGSPARKGSH